MPLGEQQTPLMANPFGVKVGRSVLQFRLSGFSFSTLIRAVKSRNQRNSWLVFAFEDERRAAIGNDFSSRLYHDTRHRYRNDHSIVLRLWYNVMCVFVTVGHERFSEPSCPSNCSDDVLVSRDRQNERETS